MNDLYDDKCKQCQKCLHEDYCIEYLESSCKAIEKYFELDFKPFVKVLED